MIVDSPDAYHLPQQPGHGYLKVDTTMYARFTAAYVSGPVPDEVESDSDDIAQDVLPWPVMALLSPIRCHTTVRHVTLVG